MSMDKQIKQGIEAMNKPETRKRITQLAYEMFSLIAPGASLNLVITERKAIIVQGQPEYNEAHLIITRPVVWGNLQIKVEAQSSGLVDPKKN